MVGYYGLALVVCLTVHSSIFLFPEDNLSKYQKIFAKLGMCIDIVEIWFGIANGQILSILIELSAQDMHIFLFPENNLVNINRFSPNLVCALIL